MRRKSSASPLLGDFATPFAYPQEGPGSETCRQPSGAVAGRAASRRDSGRLVGHRERTSVKGQVMARRFELSDSHGNASRIGSPAGRLFLDAVLRIARPGGICPGGSAPGIRCFHASSGG